MNDFENALKVIGEFDEVVYGVNPYIEAEGLSECCGAKIVEGRCYDCKENI